MNLIPTSKTIGRRYATQEDLLTLDPFKRDWMKVMESKAYRRLGSKTQVFTSPTHTHVRTREAHSDEVAVAAVNISSNLGLNDDLCMAIALGHDLGHTPYGHLGEIVFSKLIGKKFWHNVNSVVVAQHIERKGSGLDLTYETLQGMLYHSRKYRKKSKQTQFLPEHDVVMHADKIAFTFSDLNDAIRYGYLTENQIPDCAKALGTTQRTRMNNTIAALLDESESKGRVIFSEGEVYNNFKELQGFLTENVYVGLNLKNKEVFLETAVEFFDENPRYKAYNPILLTSLMTDYEVTTLNKMIAECGRVESSDIRHFGVVEIINDFEKSWGSQNDPAQTDLTKLDFLNPDLNWVNTANQSADYSDYKADK